MFELDMGEMSKLRVIAHLIERGDELGAKAVAKDIENPEAQTVAQALLDHSSPTNSLIAEVVADLRSWAEQLKRRQASA